jgi:hypothetical protein
LHTLPSEGHHKDFPGAALFASCAKGAGFDVGWVAHPPQDRYCHGLRPQGMRFPEDDLVSNIEIIDRGSYLRHELASIFNDPETIVRCFGKLPLPQTECLTFLRSQVCVKKKL